MNGLSDDDVEFLNHFLGSDDDDSGDQPASVTPPKSSSRLPTKPASPRSPTHAPSPFRVTPTHQRSSSRVESPSNKCVQVCLGGTKVPVGMTSDVKDPHFCSNLFCISCDHIVIRFADRRWKAATDYLFLRNNYPDNVQQNLVFAPGWCAFCCQCTFAEESGVKKLAPYSTNWVCRGHR